jgi:hypothetical protein
MNKICTSIEQSKKLIELGIDVNTADMYYYDKNIFSGAMSAFNGVLLIRGDKFPDNTTPAWSLSALLKILPLPTLEETPITTTETKWKCTIYCDAKYWSELHNNPIDAAFEMVCWLLENKKL